MTEATQSFMTGLEYAQKKYRKTKIGTKNHPEIIRYFSKTPKTIVCPHFYELNWAYGCNFDCAYCYLQGTFRGNKDPRHISLAEVFHALNVAFNDQWLEASIFNSGELTDSLVYPEVIEQIVDKFEEQNKHKLLLLTKSGNVGFLVKKLRKQTIVSFSINSPTVAKRWENKTPPIERRIEAARRVNDRGYKVRIRIDPIFPIVNWQEEYGKLIELLLSKFTPSRITLGTPRGLLKTMLYSKDKSWAKVAFEDNPVEASGWGKKIASPIRKKIYAFIFDKLQGLGFAKSNIALCKETESMWKELEISPGRHPQWDNCKCNCTW